MATPDERRDSEDGPGIQAESRAYRVAQRPLLPERRSPFEAAAQRAQAQFWYLEDHRCVWNGAGMGPVKSRVDQKRPHFTQFLENWTNSEK
jgi:hypothetical protein